MKSIIYSISNMAQSVGLRTKIPIPHYALNPKIVPNEIIDKMTKNQSIQKLYYDRNVSKNTEDFVVGEEIYMQNIHNKEWEKGRMIEKLPQPRSFLVRNNNGGVQRRNTIHIRKIKRGI